MKTYLRFLTPKVEPFDPLELAKETEKIVCQKDQRKFIPPWSQIFDLDF